MIHGKSILLKEQCMSKIIFFEPRCEGMTHVDSASALLIIFKQIFPNGEFIFYTEKAHGEYTQKVVPFPFTQIDISVDIPNRRNRFTMFWDVLMLFKIKKQRPDYLVVLSVPTFPLFFYAKLFCPRIKTLITFHSMETLGVKGKYHFYKAFYWFWRSVSFHSKNVAQLVYGDCIRDRIKEYRPHAEFVSLDLPCPLAVGGITEQNNGKIIFGAWPGGHGDVGVGTLVVLENALHEYADEYEIRFKGNLWNIIPKLPDTRILSIYGSGKFLEPESLNHFLDEMDYCIFPYPPDKYQFTASGGLLAVLSHLKPVIAFRTRYFEYVFDKMGDIGYLCNNADEMIHVVKNIIQNRDREHYRKQQETILRGMKHFAPEQLALKMREILEALV
jgi:hypothetical protein